MNIVTENIHTVGNANMVATYNNTVIGEGIAPQFADVSIQFSGDHFINLGKVFIGSVDDLRTSDVVERWRGLMVFASKTYRS